MPNFGGGTLTPITYPAVPAAGTVTQTPEHFPLELFRKEMSIHPFHFWQLANALTPLNSACNALLFQHAWQDADKIGRDDIQASIDGAVDKLAVWLGYSPIPHFVEETLNWAGGCGRGSVRLSEGQIQALGVESLALLNDVAAVVYSDVDGDGLNDTFTVTQATAVTDASEIAVYFSSLDRLSDDLNDWRIHPVRVLLSGGNAIITGPAWILVNPSLYQGVTNPVLDPSTAGNFVSTVAVYQRSVYTAGQTFADAQATLIYATHAAPYWGWGWPSSPTNGSTDPAVQGYAVARAGIADANLGEVTPARSTYDATSGTWSADGCWPCGWGPDLVTVRYLAGWPLTATNQISHRIVQLVSRFAVAEMPRPIAACQEALREIYYWQFDLARSSGAADEAYGMISRSDLENPFGTRRGQVWAWKSIQRLQTLQGIVV